MDLGHAIQLLPKIPQCVNQELGIRVSVTSCDWFGPGRAMGHVAGQNSFHRRNSLTKAATGGGPNTLIRTQFTYSSTGA
jgi:hypothetical protein